MTKILISDEHQMNRELLAAELRKRGFTVLTAENGLDLRSKIDPNCLPDLAIIRYKSTRANSISNIKFVRSAFPTVKVIVLCLHIKAETQTKLKELYVEGIVMQSLPGIASSPLEAVKAVLMGSSFFPSRTDQI